MALLRGWCARALVVVTALGIGCSGGGGGSGDQSPDGSAPPARSAALQGRAAAIAGARAKGELDARFQGALAKSGAIRFQNAPMRLTATVDQRGAVFAPTSGHAWHAALHAAAIECGGRSLALEDAAPRLDKPNRVLAARREGNGSVDEWYVNGPLGVEQGFTIHDGCDGQIVIHVELEGLGARRRVAGGVAFADAMGAQRLAYTDLSAHDAAGRELGATMTAAPGGIDLRVDAAAATYPVEVDPLVWVEEQALDPSDLATGDRFGGSVALSGDSALVGVSTQNSATGSVYVFVRSGTTWPQQQKLTASDAANGDAFGSSVAASGDSALIGAYVKGDVGAAYVFVRTGTSWTQQQKLTASDPALYDSFGYSAAIDADTALVGANEKNTGKGAAYVFVRTGTSWTQQQELTASDGTAYNYFGVSVAVHADTAVVGAENNSGKGAAYVFVRTGTSWTQQQKLTASDGLSGDYFGNSVGVYGDTAFIGAQSRDDTIGANVGAVYVFDRTGTTWAQSQMLTASDAAATSQFGWSLALVQDTGFVGAVGGNGGTGEGYVFNRTGTTWSESSILKATDGVSGDGLGMSISGSVDTALVGASNKNSNAGVAYVFHSGSALGDSCSADTECASRHCVDGVCCDTACGNACDACSVAAGGKVDGNCAPVAMGSPGSPACAPLACDGMSATCVPCGKDAMCTAGNYCDSSGNCQPQKTLGGSCDLIADCLITKCRECASGNCVDGVCCDTACSGSCDACSVSAGASADGTCTLLSLGTQGNPSCSPLVCTGSSASCPTNCTTDSQCETGYYCAVSQTCQLQKTQGNLCDETAGVYCNAANCRMCASGNCVDGYCCDTACSGTCQACSGVKKGSGGNGTCGPIASGTDPDNECTAASPTTCGLTGSCDGSGACALYASGTVCQASSCTNSTTQDNAHTCDGAGTCVAHGTTDCSPYACSGTSCVGGSCSNDSQCTSGYYCSAAGQCVTQKSQGATCNPTADCKDVSNCTPCATGNCVDGVCCDTACGGSCDACSTATGASADGTCTVLSAGAAGSPACAPYLCSGSSAACPGTCLTDADCDSTHYCASDQTCKPQKGQGLKCDSGAGGDCQVSGCRVCSTGNCVDGYCCDTACSGTCQACSTVKKGSGVNGTCGAVASNTDPDGDCTADPAPSCGKNGSCDGAGACALYASGTVCQPQACANGTTQNNADTCDGNGTCVDKGTTSCSPYSCTGGGCVGGSCTKDADCQSGYYCGADSQCHSQKSQGQSCNPATDCVGGSCNVCGTGHCVDGVCCDTACGGACDACSAAAGASADGTCTILSLGGAGSPACAPFVCDGSSAACPTACVSDAGCDATHYCAADQTCKPKKVQGSLCDKSAGADCFNTGCGVCQTGYCVDGFCCDTACDGVCQSCSSAAKGTGNNGSCGSVADGTDPDSDCSPFVCAAGACTSGCSTNSDCGTGKVCVPGTGQCVTPVDQGQACQNNEECKSGFCVDKVCCDTACTGQCEACDAATPGTCVGIDGDPHGARPKCASDGSACAGTCKSQNRAQCTYPPTTTDCGSPTCTNGSAETFACDGQGTCAAKSKKDCSPYVCDTTACKTSCASNTDCTQGFGCSADGHCVPTGNSQCVENDTKSQTPTGLKDCAPFMCRTDTGSCYETCSGSSQCAAGAVCDPTTKTCVKASSSAGSQDQGGCGCRTAGSREPGGAPVLALLSLLLLGAYRRRDRG